MKLCPNCQNPAKPSSSYPGMFVCSCLGILEDITLIKSPHAPKAQVKSDLLYGQISYAPKRTEILGSIICTKGEIYHFDRDVYPFGLGEFVCFKPTTWTTDGSFFSVPGAIELQPFRHID